MFGNCISKCYGLWVFQPCNEYIFFLHLFIIGRNWVMDFSTDAPVHVYFLIAPVQEFSKCLINFSSFICIMSLFPEAHLQYHLFYSSRKHSSPFYLLWVLLTCFRSGGKDHSLELSELFPVQYHSSESSGSCRACAGIGQQVRTTRTSDMPRKKQLGAVDVG